MPPEFRLGAMYRTRSGEVVGPLELHPDKGWTRVPQNVYLYGLANDVSPWNTVTFEEDDADLMELI